MASWTPGQPASNTGPSPSQASFNLNSGNCQVVPMIGITKDANNVFRFYGMNSTNSTNYSAPVLLWTSNAFSDWSINYQNQPINLMGKGQGSFFAPGKLFSAYIFSRQLNATEIAQLYHGEYIYINNGC
jgi:hypothetical protein